MTSSAQQRHRRPTPAVQLPPPASRERSRLGERRRFAVWVSACLAVCLLLRLPYGSLALGIDEGGLALVAAQWSEGSGSLYGRYWLDRSPVLIALYQLALLGGDAGVRILGTAAALSLVVVVSVLARLLAGQVAGMTAAAIGALLMASPAIHAVFTPAELLAAVPSVGAVTLLVMAWDRPHQRRLLFAAGALATVALLVKQSFLCAAAAAAVFAIIRMRQARDQPARRSLREVAPLVGGMALPLLLVEIWAAAFGPGVRALNYALLGFRLDALAALQESNRAPAERMLQLLWPMLESGLVLPLVAAPLGLLALRRSSPTLSLVLLAWLIGALTGVVSGGYYWRHYLIQLVPPLVVLASVAAARLRRRTVVSAVGGMAALTVVTSIGASLYIDRWPYQADVRAVVSLIDEYEAPGDDIQVLYARANLVHYSGMQSPLPYQWSSMYRVMPEAERQLRAVLASDDRPTWVVAWQSPGSFGLDRTGMTRHLVASHYRRIATVCGHPVYLRKERQAPEASRIAETLSCASTGASLSQMLQRVL